MQDIMGDVRYNKSLTITNMQLIITEIGFCVCHTGNIWSNVMIRTCVRKLSGRIFCQCNTKEEVGWGLIAMMGKLRTLLCIMSINVAKLTFYLLSWPLVWCYRPLMVLLPLSTMIAGLWPRRTTISTMKRLTAKLRKIVVMITLATQSASAPMSHETSTIRPRKSTLGSID